MFVFVYGSLKKGFHNNRVLGDAQLVGTGNIDGYDMYSLGGYPGIVVGSGNVKGEVYEITDKHLPWLDRLEGYSENWKPDDCMYLRQRVTVDMDQPYPDDLLQAWVYIYNGDVSRRKKIEDGVWQ